MKRPRVFRPAGLFALLALTLVLTACGAAPGASSTTASPPDAPAADAPSQTNEGNQVTITATWAGMNAGPVFDIAMDTHAVDLDGYNLRQLAVLRVDDGATIEPTSWDAPKGGHHRKGTLTFPSATAEGRAVLGSQARTVELIIRDVAGVPVRSFRWIL
jgi:hypothetical protein